jgi:protein-S-isoprenylcysteine O-methyltransferase Ste14
MTIPGDASSRVVALALLALLIVAMSWAVAGVCLIASLRLQRPTLREGASPSGLWLELWHAAGLAALIPLPGMWRTLGPDAVVLFRLCAASLLALTAAGIAVWELGTRRRYRERSRAVIERDRFLTYGPYRRIRRPRELAILLLVIATSIALPGWWRPVLAACVFVPSVVVRARRLEADERRRWGAEFDRYRQAVPLLIPRGRSQSRRVERDRFTA